MSGTGDGMYLSLLIKTCKCCPRGIKHLKELLVEKNKLQRCKSKSALHLTASHHPDYFDYFPITAVWSVFYSSPLTTGDGNFSSLYWYNDYKALLHYICVKHSIAIPSVNILTHWICIK